MPLVVVGVDGSEASNAALRFAAEEASLRGGKLRVVCAWEVPAAYFTGGLLPSDDLISAFEEHAKDVTASALSEAARLAPEVDREAVTLQGHPGDVLAQQSTGADLLVVGSRGLGGFRSLVLGSVSLHVAHHARCPVAIIPPAQRAR
jgi:nucleotide-binding universal stress UspA family protein